MSAQQKAQKLEPITAWEDICGGESSHLIDNRPAYTVFQSAEEEIARLENVNDALMAELHQMHTDAVGYCQMIADLLPWAREGADLYAMGGCSCPECESEGIAGWRKGCQQERLGAAFLARIASGEFGEEL